jgi:hypothetical protein
LNIKGKHKKITPVYKGVIFCCLSPQGAALPLRGESKKKLVRGRRLEKNIVLFFGAS